MNFTYKSQYFLAPEQSICEAKLKESGAHLAWNNDFSKRICLAPNYTIKVVSIINQKQENGTYREYSSELITFHVYSPYNSIKNALNQVKELMNERTPKDDENYKYSWGFSKLETDNFGPGVDYFNDGN